MSSVTDLPDTHQHLLAAPLTAALTTLDAEGRPQTTAVWYLLRDGELISSITDVRQKYRNLSANPHCTLFVIDPADPQRTLEIRAEATLEPDPDKRDVREIARAYGADPERIASLPGLRHTIRFTPHRIVLNPPPAQRERGHSS